jgi:hypothetical protein
MRGWPSRYPLSGEDGAEVLEPAIEQVAGLPLGPAGDVGDLEPIVTGEVHPDRHPTRGLEPSQRLPDGLGQIGRLEPIIDVSGRTQRDRSHQLQAHGPGVSRSFEPNDVEGCGHGRSVDVMGVGGPDPAGRRRCLPDPDSEILDDVVDVGPNEATVGGGSPNEGLEPIDQGFQLPGEIG